MGSRTGVGKSERTEAASPRGRASVSRVPPFSRAADYSPGLVFHAKRFIYSGISLKVSRNGGGELGQRLRFRFAMEIVSGATCRRICTQQDKFCTGGRLNISDITFEYISSAFGRHL